ncbi:FmdB family zinc ribbon protein [Geopsychrobacter electrodiphilus]|uniref:FmdB family zinc ribbon protein n=1 Tax=Geopsychrobacter electrodiphilus TaxID=225196 RepID=UPI000A0069E8|nr:zinc ribbon domain-containing protein [Geopsychrobacter electrodiphilus]
MPIYEYECESCGIVFEARQKFSDAPLVACRECGGRVSKQISRAGFALKGGGWYEQGYNNTVPSCSGGEGGGCSGCPKSSNG